jgi:putative membrane protein
VLVAALVVAGLAALIHVYIFVLESLRWTVPSTRRTFGVSELQAEQSKDLAFNQGFYNLFLTIAVAGGIVVTAVGDHRVGITLVFVGAGSMLAASLVLVARSPKLLRAALVQGLLPLVAIVLLVVCINS